MPTELFHQHFVHITPEPIFAGLERFYDGMFRAVVMLRRVFILGGVAASDMPAGHAKPQMDPRVSGFQTLLASLSAGVDLVNFFCMCASVWSHRILLACQISIDMYHIRQAPEPDCRRFIRELFPHVLEAAHEGIPALVESVSLIHFPCDADSNALADRTGFLHGIAQPYFSAGT